MHTGCKFLILFFLCCISSCAPAQTPGALNATLSYRFTFDGIPFGEMHIESTEKDGTFALQSTIRSTYLARLFSRHASHASVKGAPTGDVTRSTRVFETAYDNNDEPNRIRLAFTGGMLTDRYIQDPDPPGKRPPIDAAELQGATDLLTYILAVRQEWAKAQAAHAAEFHVKLYDGRRLMDTIWTPSPQNPYACTVRRAPLGGYTQKELKRMKNDPAVSVTFTDDGTLVPTKLRMMTLLGPVQATLQNAQK